VRKGGLTQWAKNNKGRTIKSKNTIIGENGHGKNPYMGRLQGRRLENRYQETLYKKMQSQRRVGPMPRTGCPGMISYYNPTSSKVSKHKKKER